MDYPSPLSTTCTEKTRREQSMEKNRIAAAKCRLKRKIRNEATEKQLQTLQKQIMEQNFLIQHLQGENLRLKSVETLSMPIETLESFDSSQSNSFENVQEADKLFDIDLFIHESNVESSPVKPNFCSNCGIKIKWLFYIWNRFPYFIGFLVF